MPLDDTSLSTKLDRLRSLAVFFEQGAPEWKFNMAVGLKVVNNPNRELAPLCGTAGCIAGIAAARAIKAGEVGMAPAPLNEEGNEMPWNWVSQTAAEYLGLDDAQAYRLFLSGEPIDIIQHITPLHAAKAIRRLIAGELPWPEYNTRNGHIGF